VNRRLAIKKQIESSSGLQSLSKSYPRFNNTSADFKLTNPDETPVKYFDELNLINKLNKLETSSEFGNKIKSNLIYNNNLISMSLNAKDFFLHENPLYNRQYDFTYKSLSSANNNNIDVYSEESVYKNNRKKLSNPLKASSITVVEK
jgi:hypothetical protein